MTSIEKDADAGAKRPLAAEESSSAGGAEERKRKRRSGWDSAPADGATTSNSVAGANPLLSSATSNLQSLQLLQAAQLRQQLLLQQQQALQQAQAPANTAMKRRIYVGSLYYELTENDVRIPFSAFGTILKVDMPREPTGRSKGFCFIEYATEESADAAIKTMNGFTLAGRAIKVNRPTALNSGTAASSGINFALPGLAFSGFGSLGVLGGLNPSLALAAVQAQAQATQAVSTQSAPVTGSLGTPGAAQVAAPQFLAAALAQQLKPSLPESKKARIYVGSIAFELSAENVKGVFEAFGKVRSCELLANPEKPGTHRGYGFIEFEEEKAAKDAVENMNGFDLYGRKLKVGWANSTGAPGQPSMTDPLAVLAAAQHAAAVAAAAAASSAVSVPALAQPQESLSSQENLQLKPSDRASLMQKLAARSAPECQCVLLKNLVAVNEVDDGLQQEVQEECSSFGTVEKVVVHVDKSKNQVFVFVWFATKPEAVKARESLDRRYFGGRVISATFYDEKKFLDKDYSDV